MQIREQNQIVGAKGELFVRSILPHGWISNPSETDIGVDFNVVVDEADSGISGRQFQVQVKTKSNGIDKDGSYVKVRRIKVQTIRLWFLCPVPTLIVACDLDERTAYFIWHNELYNLVDGKEPRDHVTVHIPIANVLDSDGWEKVRASLHAYYSSLSAALMQGRHARVMLPTIHDLTAAVRRLNNIDLQPIPVNERTDKQEGILAMIEILQYGLVATSLKNLAGGLNEEGKTHLTDWIDRFSRHVDTVFPQFSTTDWTTVTQDWVNVAPEYELIYVKQRIHDLRPKMVEAILEIILGLAPGRFNVKSIEEQERLEQRYGISTDALKRHF